MKKLLIGILFFLLTINVQAQWYNRRYGVNNINDLSESQLKIALQNAEKSIKTGKTLTYIGIGTTLLGGILVADGLSSMGDSWESFWNGWGEAAGGMLLMVTGSGLMVVGIPLWAVNKSRTNSIKVTLVKFNTASFTGYNQHACYGLTQPSALGLSLEIPF